MVQKCNIKCVTLSGVVYHIQPLKGKKIAFIDLETRVLLQKAKKISYMSSCFIIPLREKRGQHLTEKAI